MMRLAGLFAVLVLGGLPVVMLPDVHTLEAAAVVCAVCIVALLLPSLGLAVLGSIAALLLFSAALLIASSDAVIEAVLIGIAILTLLDATYFEQRFRAAPAKLHIAADHLLHLIVFVLLAVVAALAIFLLAPIVSQTLDATTHSFIAALGVVLVLAAMVRRANP
jgi:hypothetical protein